MHVLWRPVILHLEDLGQLPLAQVCFNLYPVFASSTSMIKVVGCPTINQLAKILVLDRTTLTRGLRPIEKMRLIKIKKGEDKRTTTLELTAKGIATMNKTLPYWKKARASVSKEFGGKFLDGLIKDLSLVRDGQLGFKQ